MRFKNWVFVFLLLMVLTIAVLYVSDKAPRVVIDQDALPPADVLASRGEYLTTIAGCGYCHTDPRQPGPYLAGGRKLSTPWGDFYTPNITPDKNSGIGNWRLEDFIRAMRFGVSPLGTHYFPAFPYTSFTGMTDEDMAAIFTYLRSVPPVEHYEPPHDTAWFVWREALRFWKKLYFHPGVLMPDPLRNARWNRGRYLAEAVGHCQECHTRRNQVGALSRSVRYSGARQGVLGEPVPNISSSRRHGIGKWTKEELSAFLRTGKRPDGTRVKGWMAEVIDAALSHLTDEDNQALTEYIKRLPEVD